MQIIPAVQTSTTGVLGTENSVVSHEDVEQTVYEKLTRAGKLFTKEPNSARKIAFNTAISVLRHEKYSQPVGDYTHPIFASTSPSAEDEAINKIFQEALPAAIDQLPTRQREVIIMMYFQDISETEIARAIGVAHGTVKTNMNKARKSLKKALGLRRYNVDNFKNY
jgi:RNA polymerase sigma factor (sigma-70 family)